MRSRILLAFLCIALPAASPAADPAPRKPCLPCEEEDKNAERGYPVKGRVLGTDPERGQVLLKHEAIPGVMRAMTMPFNVDPAIIGGLQRDQVILGRIEKRGKEWWLFNIRIMGAELK